MTIKRKWICVKNIIPIIPLATIKQVSIMGIISVGGVANGTSHMYGDITGRYVIYRGDDDKVDGESLIFRGITHK